MSHRMIRGVIRDVIFAETQEPDGTRRASIFLESELGRWQLAMAEELYERLGLRGAGQELYLVAPRDSPTESAWQALSRQWEDDK